MNIELSEKKRKVVFTLLGVAVGILYFVAYARQTFYTQMQDAMNLTNAQIGELASIYGIVALVSYFPSGIFADKYKAKNLFLITFIATAFFTFWHATFPSYNQLLIIYAGLGLSNTVFFWSTYVKTLRCMFKESEQGKAFGINESLKWLFNGILAVVGLQFLNLIPDSTDAYRWVLITAGIAYTLMGITLYKLIPDSIGGETDSSKAKEKKEKNPEDKGKFVRALKLPGTWLLTIVIFCAYILYNANIYLTPYSVEILGISESVSSILAIVRGYLLGIVAVLFSGALSDRSSSRAKVCSILFIISAIMFAGMAFIKGGEMPVAIAVSITCVATFIIIAFRGVYWAVQEEAGIPIELTGTVTGIVSVLAYSPDAFFPKVVGEILDRNPGVAGYQILFIMVAVICLIGMFTGMIIMKRAKSNKIKEGSVEA